MLIFDGLYFLNEEIKPSGYVSYDVQWIRINKKWHYRHVLFNIVHKIPIAELLAKKKILKEQKIFLKSVSNQKTPLLL